MQAIFRARRLAGTALFAGLSAAAAVPAHAQSSVQVYGLIDLSAGQFEVAGGPKLKRLDSGNRSTSYLGFKGNEDLGGGLSVGFTLESFLLADSGDAGRVPGVDAFWARNANVHLAGAFGRLRLGRMGPPLFVSTLLFNAWGDSFGYSPAIRQYYSLPHGTPLVGDSGWNNGVGYTTPTFGGLTGTVLVAAGEGGVNSRGPNVGAHLLYFGGPLALTVAWQDVQTQGTLGRPISAFPGFDKQTAWQVGGSYDLKSVKLSAQYGQIETSALADVDTTNWHFSASVPLGGGAILATYGESERETAGVAGKPTSKILTAGYSYNLSKRTDLYGVYMSDKFTGLSSGDTYAVGLRHTF